MTHGEVATILGDPQLSSQAQEQLLARAVEHPDGLVLQLYAEQSIHSSPGNGRIGIGCEQDANSFQMPAFSGGDQGCSRTLCPSIVYIALLQGLPNSINAFLLTLPLADASHDHAIHSSSPFSCCQPSSFFLSLFLSDSFCFFLHFVALKFYFSVSVHVPMG